MTTVCRLCLKHAIDCVSFHSTDSSGFSTTSLLNALVPELYLGLSPNPVVCKACYFHLRQAYVFRLRCLRSENLIGIYIRETKNADNLILLDDVVNFWKKRYLNKSEGFQDNLEEWFGKAGDNPEEPIILNQIASIVGGTNTSEDSIPENNKLEDGSTSDLQKEIPKDAEKEKKGDCSGDISCKPIGEKENTNKESIDTIIDEKDDDLIVIEDAAKDFDVFSHKAGVETWEDTMETIKIVVDKSNCKEQTKATLKPLKTVKKVIEEVATGKTSKDQTETIKIIVDPDSSHEGYNAVIQLPPKVLTKRSQTGSGTKTMTESEVETNRRINLICDFDDMDISSLVNELQKEENLEKLGFSTDSGKSESYFLKKFIDKTDNSFSFALLRKPVDDDKSSTEPDVDGGNKNTLLEDEVKTDDKKSQKENAVENPQVIDEVVEVVKKKLSIDTSVNLIESELNEIIAARDLVVLNKNKTGIGAKLNEEEKDEKNFETALDTNVKISLDRENVQEISVVLPLNDKIELEKAKIDKYEVKSSNKVPEDSQNISIQNPRSPAEDIDEESLGIIMFPPDPKKPPDPLPSTSQDTPLATPMPIIRVRPASALQKVRTLNHELWPRKEGNPDVRDSFEVLYPALRTRSNEPHPVRRGMPAKMSDGKKMAPPIVLNSQLDLSGGISPKLTSLPIRELKGKQPMLKTYNRKSGADQRVLKRVNPLTYKALEEMQKLGLIKVVGVADDPDPATQGSNVNVTCMVRPGVNLLNFGDIPLNPGLGNKGDQLETSGAHSRNSGNSSKNSGDPMDRRGSRDDKIEEAIDIKEEPLNCTENDILTDFGHDDRDAELEDETTRSATETCFMDPSHSDNDFVKTIMDTIPEVGEVQYDEPEYVHINNVTFSDLAKMMGESKKYRDSVERAQTKPPKTSYVPKGHTSALNCLGKKTIAKPRKSQTWDPKNMRLAIVAVEKENLSAFEASVAFKVPKMALELCLKKLQEKGLPSPISIHREKLEEELDWYCLEMDRCFFGISTKDVQRLASQLLCKRGFANKPAVFDDLLDVNRFLNRHPNICLRDRQDPSTQSLTLENLNRFFNLLEPALETISFNPARVFCVDQSGITFNEYLTVVTFKNYAHFQKLSDFEKKVLVTPMFCMNATGQFIPPVLIFSSEFLGNKSFKKDPKGALRVFNSSGWIQHSIFVKWLKHFISNVDVKPTKLHPIVLVLNGNLVHIRNAEIIDMARENHIILISLPPNSSNKLQPLDLSFMPLFRKYYSQVLNKLVSNDPHFDFKSIQICGILGQAYGQCATAEVSADGFEKAGIIPFKRYIFNEFCSTNQSTEGLALRNEEEGLCLDVVTVEGSNKVTDGPEIIENLPKESVEKEKKTQTEVNCFKSCFVPDCASDSIRNKGKIFVELPEKEDVQKIWYRAVGQEYPGYQSQTYCCEDHFDIENDMINHILYRMHGGRALVKKSVFPCLKTPKETIEAINAIPSTPSHDACSRELPDLGEDENEIDTHKNVDNTDFGTNKTLSGTNSNLKYCFVPGCENNSIWNPEKAFIMLPKSPCQLRKWAKSVGLKSFFVGKFCCVDHFDENDFRYSIRHKELGTTLAPRMLLKGVIPHKNLPKKKNGTTNTEEMSKLKPIKPDIGVKEKIDKSEVISIEEPSKSIDVPIVRKVADGERGVRYCFVPGCGTNSRQHPKKLYALVPREEKEQKLWFRTFNMPLSSDNKKYYCCEDHFTIKPGKESVARDKKFGGLVPRSCVQLTTALKVDPPEDIPSSTTESMEQDKWSNYMTSCIAPNCINTIEECPDKHFIRIPLMGKVQRRWYKALGLEYNPLGQKSSDLCCEDHFSPHQLKMYKQYGRRVLTKSSFTPRPIKTVEPSEPISEGTTSMPFKHSNWKYCFVPNCKNVSYKGIKKLFLSVPFDETVQKRWTEAVGRQFTGAKRNLWCCEDHFDIEQDIPHYWIHKNVTGELELLNKDVIPHKGLHGEGSSSEPPSKKLKIEDIKTEVL